MKLIINIDTFRQYYDEMIACKNVLNTNADRLNSNDENNLEALIPIENEYGRDMIKRQIAYAILKNSNNYNEKVRQWADNAAIAKFIYETDNVLSEYIPDHLSEAALEAIALDFMEKEKSKEKFVSEEGTEYELQIHNEGRSLLSVTNPDGITLYCHCQIIPEAFEHANICFSDKNMDGLSFSYHEAYKSYIEQTIVDEREQKFREKLLEQYNAFKDKMLGNSHEDIFEACYKIAAIEDVYFHITENLSLSEMQKNYIINSDENMLELLANDWYEYGDYNDELNTSVESSFEQIISEKDLLDEELDEESELE